MNATMEKIDWPVSISFGFFSGYNHDINGMEMKDAHVIEDTGKI